MFKLAQDFFLIFYSVKKPTWAAGTPDNFMGFHEYCGEIRNIGLDGELSDWGLGEVPISMLRESSLNFN